MGALIPSGATEEVKSRNGEVLSSSMGRADLPMQPSITRLNPGEIAHGALPGATPSAEQPADASGSRPEPLSRGPGASNAGALVSGEACTQCAI